MQVHDAFLQCDGQLVALAVMAGVEVAVTGGGITGAFAEKHEIYCKTDQGKAHDHTDDNTCDGTLGQFVVVIVAGGGGCGDYRLGGSHTGDSHGGQSGSRTIGKGCRLQAHTEGSGVGHGGGQGVVVSGSTLSGRNRDGGVDVSLHVVSGGKVHIGGRGVTQHTTSGGSDYTSPETASRSAQTHGGASSLGDGVLGVGIQGRGSQPIEANSRRERNDWGGANRWGGSGSVGESSGRHASRGGRDASEIGRAHV